MSPDAAMEVNIGVDVGAVTEDAKTSKDVDFGSDTDFGTSMSWDVDRIETRDIPIVVAGKSVRFNIGRGYSRI